MKLSSDIFSVFEKGWALATAGTPEDFNTMTIGWGSAGTLWGKDTVMVYIKPCRYTHDYMEKNEYFTVSFFPESCRKALVLLGTKSGRDGDKVAESGLTPISVGEGKAVSFAEAEQTVLCRKIYRQELDAAACPPEVREAFYAEEAPHTVYVGEVAAIL